MATKIKVLLLVGEAWRGNNSGGNVISNFFNGMKDVELAQIYYEDDLPDTNLCEHFFQIPQRQVIRNFLLHKKVGHEIIQNGQSLNNNKLTDTPQLINRVKSYIVRVRPQFLILIKNIIWRFSNWKSRELQDFILKFNPDVIYAPCYASPFRLAMIRYVKEMTNKKVVTLSGDDNYSLRQFSLSPFFWINRLWQRHALRKTYPYFDRFFSMSEDESVELRQFVKTDIDILRKGVRVPNKFSPRLTHTPIKMIYAGGLYLKRYACLLEIARTLREINKERVKAELHIYTATKLSRKVSKQLNDGISTFNHGLISSDELSKAYQDYDIAIHCESFDLQNRLTTRLSFSTKIIDCFQSGCAILAIAWKEQTGLKYLKNEDAAICVTSLNDIRPIINEIISNPELISLYARKAYDCEVRNHRIEDVQRILYNSLFSCSHDCK